METVKIKLINVTPTKEGKGFIDYCQKKNSTSKGLGFDIFKQWFEPEEFRQISENASSDDIEKLFDLNYEWYPSFDGTARKSVKSIVREDGTFILNLK